MKRTTLKSIVLVLMLLAATSLQAQDIPSATDIESRIDSMSLEHKVAQMFMVTLHGAVLTEVGAEHLREWQPGGLVLFGENVGNPAAVTRLTNGYQSTITEAGGVPLLVSIDQEGGVVTRLTDGFTMFPTPILLGAAGTDMAYRAGQAVAEELSAVGINMNLAPVADLETYRDNPIIARRSWGSDPEIAGDALAAYIRGMESLNVLGTAKHFPGHGETRQDSHGELPTVDLPLDRLESVELVPFEKAIAADVAAVMVAHIWFPALEPQPMLPASLSHNVITDVLRDQMGYDGLIMTDALDMNAVDMNYNFYDAIVMSIQAGSDLLAMGPSIGQEVFEAAMQHVVDSVRTGTISEERIDESVRRILETKQRYGILNWQALDPATAADRVNLEAHAQLFDEMYQAGVTVAYDRNDLVPIPADRHVAIIFLATRYQIQAECSQYSSNITWTGVSDNPSQEEIGWAVGNANSVDTVVVWTQGADKNPEQQALVNALPPEKTIAVAIWSVYDWQTYPNVAA
ncbi:MAG: glycoside hydrolase family 3 protein, partial [Chloroflexota bacterium]